MVSLQVGDCLQIMNGMEPESVDSIVTDPPYGLAFMGKDWDHGVPGIPFWEAALRVAKPGAHLLAFGGTRTFHRLAVAIEDAGWELRDTVMWVYGSGFPKSHDVSKAIDREAGAENVVGYKPDRWTGKGNALNFSTDRAQEQSKVTAPATPDAERWAGWGTALKPAWEPVIVARKPLVGTVAANVLAWGTGAINVDKCRVEAEKPIPAHHGTNGANGHTMGARREYVPGSAGTVFNTSGRWPANLVHDGSDEVVALFPVTTQIDRRRRIVQHQPPGQNGIYGAYDGADDTPAYNDTGSAARFFYCAKASRADRDEGLEGMPKKMLRWSSGEQSPGTFQSEGTNKYARNHHPTVKPTDLMRYLCRLVTPPGGVVLDPFMGSGSTGKGAVLEGFSFVGIDLDAEYVEIARRRIEAHWCVQARLL